MAPHTAHHHTALGSSVVGWSQDWADDEIAQLSQAASMEQQHNNEASEDAEGARTKDKAKPPQIQRSVAFDLSSPSEDKQEEKTRRVTIR